MTLTLILMRHAKSSWGSPQLSDHDRPLNKRGVRSAQALGAWMRKKGYLPDAAVISSSARTQETFARLGLAISADIRRSLYLAEETRMLDVLKAQREPVILMIGHNPGIATMAENLVMQAPDHPRFHDYPTGATTVIRWDAEAWKDIGWRTDCVGGQPVDFTVPRDLIAAG